ncbi:MAG: hypothetical protein NTV94_15325 [Planctomycetota bacterium]|nr:hypothetical protein [Planctomycetota bacterium]
MRRERAARIIWTGADHGIGAQVLSEGVAGGIGDGPAAAFEEGVLEREQEIAWGIGGRRRGFPGIRDTRVVGTHGKDLVAS